MFHNRNGVRMHVNCFGCLSRSGHNSRLSIPKEGDSEFPAVMVIGGGGGTTGCQTPIKEEKEVHISNYQQLIVYS